MQLVKSYAGYKKQKQVLENQVLAKCPCREEEKAV